MKKSIKYLIVLITVLIASILLFIPTIKTIKFGLDLQGGFEILYKIKPLVDGEKLTENDLNNTYKAIVNRIDTLGVSEPVITIEGKDTLRIQLPGVKDETEAKDIISTIGLLSFRDTKDNLLMTSEILGKNGASADTDSKTLKPIVKLDIKDTDAFYDATKAISESSDNRMVIWLDFDPNTDSYETEKTTCGSEENTKCLSAAYVEEGLNSSQVIIQGNFTKEKVNRLVELINAGSLPTKLVEDSTPHSVSASFGQKTIEKCGIAGLITMALISALLIFKYRFAGFISSISLIIYSLLTFLIFNGIGGVLTLPGIAALILGIGMAVDSTIIAIERIKDEYGSNIKDACNSGTKMSLSAIIDANLTTFLVALILYIFGESTIKGFATMLIVSIVVTIIAMVAINTILIKKAAKSEVFKDNPKAFFGRIGKKPKFDYVKLNKYALIIFGVIIAAGITFTFINKINLGVDFSGGTSINMTSEKNINFDDVLPVVKKYNVSKYSHYVGTQKEGYVKLNKILSENDSNIVSEKLSEVGINTSINEISTMVVKNLTKNAIYSLLIAFIAIIIYVAIRFNFNFGVSGLAALFHDVLLIIIAFIIFKVEFNFIIIAALLTIIGYSINDTIVVFDRIRENKKLKYKNKITNKEDLKDLMNDSMNDVLSRNILTTVTTVISILTLVFLGVNEIYTFNLAIFIGLIFGCVSSIVFAPNLWRYLEGRNIGVKKVKATKVKPNHKAEIDEMSIKGINS